MTRHLRILSRYTRLGASSRLRTMQYRPWLEQDGWTVEHLSFFDDAYLERVYRQDRKGSGIARYYRKRLADLRRTPKPDLIWLEYEAFPWLPWFLESALLPKNVGIVSDYDDAIFHRYDQHPRAVIRALLGPKIDYVMAYSRLVTAGNTYLAQRAQAAGAARVEIVPTVVDLNLYHLRKGSAASSLRVGWIGTPHTWETLASSIYETLLPELAAQGAMFRAVGAALKERTEKRLELVPWSEGDEVHLIQGMDIGVMPMPDTPWTRGKCGYKLIQYMACGLPVVAAPVGVNTKIVEHGVNGFLAETDAEWQSSIGKLLQDSKLRQRMGAAGRKKVEAEYSLQVWAPRVSDMLSHTVAAPH